MQARAKVNEDDKKPIWFPVVGGGLTKEDMLCVDIRRLQQRSGCSDVTCKEVLQMFKQYLGDLPTGFRSVDKKMQKAAGASVLRLHGCMQCNQHVYHPDDEAHLCTHVKVDGTVCGHPRYDKDGKPNEVNFVNEFSPALLFYQLMCMCFLLTIT